MLPRRDRCEEIGVDAQRHRGIGVPSIRASAITFTPELIAMTRKCASNRAV